MVFIKKKVGEVKEFKSNKDFLVNILSPKNVIKIFVLLFAVGLIIAFGGSAYNYGKKTFKTVSIGAVKIISEQIGQEMKQDELGQVNVMIVGYGGASHQGGFLADTTMIASFNPKVGAVTFLSIPRDLYVKYDKGGAGRFNAVFALEYQKTKSLDLAAKKLSQKLTDITEIPIDYYALIDFQGFMKLVDGIGGIQVDVPKDFVDPQYPTRQGGYTVFKVSKGLQNFDGETALKYARSRHSTSDFSRALRQQQIIKAIVNRLLSAENLTDIDNLKKLYNQYNEVVHTNITFKNMLGMVKYLDKVKHYFSYVYSADCNWTHYSVMGSACMLTYGNREAFGGASVLLPLGATPSSIDHYKEMRNFASYVVYNQKYQIENPTLGIVDSTQKLNKKGKKGVNASINKLAIRLKNYAFNVSDLQIAEKNTDKTILYKNGTGDYSNTIEMLGTMVNITQVLTGNSAFENDLTLIIGDDFITN